MGTSPVVSIVIPVLDGERHIEACVNSVLQQSFEDFEVVVSVNVSKDRTTEILRSFRDPRVRVLPELTEQLSVHDNWSRGLEAASGEFVKIVCHDDLLVPNALAAQVQCLQRHDDVVMVCGRRRIIDDDANVLIKARGLGSLLRRPGLHEVSAGEIAHACARAGTNLLGEPANVLIRRAALPHPLFDPQWRYAMDIEFYLRCLGTKNAIVDRRVVCCFRVSPNQMSAVVAKDQVREVQLLLHEMAQRYPTAVSAADVRRGGRMAQLTTLGRRALYLKLRWRARMSQRRSMMRRTDESPLERLE